MRSLAAVVAAASAALAFPTGVHARECPDSYTWAGNFSAHHGASCWVARKLARRYIDRLYDCAGREPCYVRANQRRWGCRERYVGAGPDPGSSAHRVRCRREPDHVRLIRFTYYTGPG